MRPILLIMAVCGLLAAALWYVAALAGDAPPPGPAAVFLGAILAIWVVVATRARPPLLFLSAVGFLLLPLFFPRGWLGILPTVVAGLLFWPSVLPVPRRRRPPDPLRLVLCREAAFPHAPVALSGEERFLHLHVLGPTGAGKSSAVLLPLILQDLDRKDAGLTLFDPKGDLAAAVADACRRRGRPFILFDPSDPACPPVNLLAGDRVRAAEAAAYAFDKAFGGDNPFYRNLGQNLLRHSLLALKESLDDRVRLSHLLALWTDDAFRLRTLSATTDRVVRAYFRDQFLRWNPRQLQENTAGVANQLAAILANPNVRRAVESDAAFTPHDVLAEGMVLLVVLAPGELGAGASLLGTLLLAALQQAAFALVGAGKPHFLYLDEFHLFAASGFAEFLALARSYRVGAILAHQHLGQLPRELREAVLANARHRLVLGGLSVDDAVVIADSAGAGRRRGRRTLRYEPTQVRELPRGTALVQLAGRRPFLGKVKPVRE